jgi:hypothetical protein
MSAPNAWKPIWSDAAELRIPIPLLGRLSRRPAWNRQARDLTGLSPSGLRLQLAASGNDVRPSQTDPMQTFAFTESRHPRARSTAHEWVYGSLLPA